VKKRRVCITHRSARDGLGHQVYNRIEWLSLANHLKLGYLNPEFSSFDYNYGDGILDKKTEEEVLDALNRFSIPALASCNHRTHKFQFHFNASPVFMRLLMPMLRLFAKLLRNNFLVYLDKAERYIDSGEFFSFRREEIFSDLLETEFLLNLRNKRLSFETNSPLHIVVVLPWARNAADASRHVALEFYQRTLKFLVDKLDEIEVSYFIKLHTDAIPNLDAKRSRWDLSTETRDYLRDKGILDSEGFNYNYLDIPRVFDFLNNEKYEVITNVSPLSIWNDFKGASIVLGSRSTLTFAGVFHTSSSSLVILPGICDIRIPGVFYVENDFQNLSETIPRIEVFSNSLYERF
jgi:hypothetical protein